MFLPKDNTLDRERLEKVIQHLERGGYIPRAGGQTVARLYLMFGEVELGDPGNSYLYVSENATSANLVAREFYNLVCTTFPEMWRSLPFEAELHLDTVILPNGQRYRFMSVDYLVHKPDAVLGQQFARVFFDVSDEVQRLYDARNSKLTDVLIYLQDHGADFV